MANDIQSKINDFWEWFARHESDFRNITDPEAVREMLDNQILNFGMFAWEIGHGTEKPLYLLLSPNGDPERFQISRRIVDAAPDFPHWEFYPARPVSEWDFVLEVYDETLALREVDTYEWEYLLREEWDGRYEVILFPDNMQGFTREIQQETGERVITAILGEEGKILHVNSVKMAGRLFAQDPDQLKPLEELKEDFMGRSRR